MPPRPGPASPDRRSVAVTRIALVASSFAPRVGGVEEHVRNLALQLRDRGHDVVVWAVDQGDADVPAAVDGIPVRYLPTPMPARRPGALLRFAWRAPGAVLRWRRAMAVDRPDVVNVHCFGPNGPWAAVMARLARRPLVVSSHGETYGDATNVFDTSPLLRHALVRALRGSAAVTACSARTLGDLETRFGLEPGRGAVVPNGIDLAEPAAPALPALPGRYLLAVGRLVGTKGFDLLLDAFAESGLAGTDLVVGGDGPELAALRAQAERLGVADRVHLLGRLSRGEVVGVMAGAVALVVPSRVEPFGIVVLEGWRAGVPLVVTSHGGPAELVTDGVDGLVRDPADTASLAVALRAVATDAALSARLGERGAQRARAYDWRDVVRHYEAVYGAVTGGVQRGAAPAGPRPDRVPAGEIGAETVDAVDGASGG